ncbi:hypothetical protein HQ571_00260 [Candidatus Kuenenbacteria bacterium]|nr:hypothetical protein [Candidatus Kuenenbacteria bacterium]
MGFVTKESVMARFNDNQDRIESAFRETVDSKLSSFCPGNTISLTVPGNLHSDRLVKIIADCTKAGWTADSCSLDPKEPGTIMLNIS